MKLIEITTKSDFDKCRFLLFDRYGDCVAIFTYRLK